MPERWAIFLDPDIQSFLLGGLLTTVQLAAITVTLSVAVGTLLAILRLLPVPIVRYITAAYIDCARSLPSFLLILYVYLALPRLGLDLPAVIRVIVGLLIYHGARQAEVVRAGILSIPKGEIDAARSLGLTYSQTMRYVILPQAVRRLLPSLTTESILAIKNTSIALVVGVTELMNRGVIIYVKYFNPLETLLIVALMYFAICYSLSQLSRRLGASPAESEAM